MKLPKFIFSKKYKGTKCIYKFFGLKIRIKKKSYKFPAPFPHDNDWLGVHSYVGGYFTCLSKETTIGKYCSIANNVSISPSQHPLNFVSTSPVFYDSNCSIGNIYGFNSCKPCHIGNDVWIGQNAVIQDGCNVGDGAVVASNAVVTKDVPPLCDCCRCACTHYKI